MGQKGLRKEYSERRLGKQGDWVFLHERLYQIVEESSLDKVAFASDDFESAYTRVIWVTRVRRIRKYRRYRNRHPLPSVFSRQWSKRAGAKHYANLLLLNPEGTGRFKYLCREATPQEVSTGQAVLDDEDRQVIELWGQGRAA